MHDFRNIISPSAQREWYLSRRDIIAFQDMGPQEMAATLIRTARQLVDAGITQYSPAIGDADWGVCRAAAALAKRLDPGIALRPEEEPDAYGDERFIDNMKLVIEHSCLMGKVAPDHEAWASAHFLGPKRVGPPAISALAIALDTLFPGTAPKRFKKDDRPAMEGLYIVGRDDGRDVSLLYREDHNGARVAYRAASALYGGEDITAELEGEARALRKIWGSRPFKEVELQTAEGEVLEAWRYTRPTVEDEDPGL